MLSLLASLLPLASALPLAPAPRDVTSDAPFSVSESDLAAAVDCTVSGAEKGVVLLMHGTGANKTVWDVTQYTQNLPGMGYDVCAINQPYDSLADAQLTAEYIAYNVQRLANQSATGKVAIVGHSQGAMNPQWALAFWPSIRELVSSYIALGPDYQGTDVGPFMCVAPDVTEGGCAPALFQQYASSNYVAALSKAGGSALVPTTVIWTSFDEVVIPHSSFLLDGASNIRIQDLCGDLHFVEHMGLIIDGGAWGIAQDALANGQADLSRVASSACSNSTGFSNELEWLEKAFDATVNIELKADPHTTEEPALMAYVCDAGAATDCASS